MNDIEKAIDMLGNRIKLGDKVVFIAPGYRKLVVGNIKSISEKTLQIEYINNWNYADGHARTLKQFHDQVITLKEEIQQPEWKTKLMGSFLGRG